VTRVEAEREQVRGAGCGVEMVVLFEVGNRSTLLGLLLGVEKHKS
jgi:hypothetical protein